MFSLSIIYTIPFDVIVLFPSLCLYSYYVVAIGCCCIPYVYDLWAQVPSAAVGGGGGGGVESVANVGGDHLVTEIEALVREKMVRHVDLYRLSLSVSLSMRHTRYPATLIDRWLRVDDDDTLL